MDKVNEILQFAKNGTPQALARFNDGECGIMLDKDFVAARGKQKGSIELQISLIDAIKHEQKNYWKGYPCTKCYPKLRQQCAEYYNPDYEYNTLAVVNTNRNLQVFSEGLQNALKGKKVVWISGADQYTGELNFDIVNHIQVVNRDSWRHYGQLFSWCQRCAKPKFVFLFSLGPTARVLVKNLFEIRPDCSFLDIGDTYSPQTKGVYRKVHRGTLKKCEVCN